MYLPAVIGGLAYAAAAAGQPYPYPQPYAYVAPPPVVYAAPPPAVTYAVPPPVYVNPVVGVPDPTIRWVQQGLNTLMRAGLIVDGMPGPATAAAVQAFQGANGLVADGIMGPATIATLRTRLNG